MTQAPRQSRHRAAALILAAALAALGGTAARAEAGSAPDPGPTADPLARWPLPAAPKVHSAWAPAATGRSLVDDFELSPWPRPDRWVQVLDLTGGASGDYVWSPRDCHPAGGARSLWAVGGGRDGAGLACGAAYPAEAAASALLLVDLTAHRQAARLGLSFDVWPDAAPNDGLFINYVAYDARGTPVERRTVYSATGRGRTWARGIRLDLTDLRDRADPAWRRDLRGQTAYLEFLFVSLPGPATGEGVHLDNLYVDAEQAASGTATPGSSQTVGCSASSDCASLTVRAFADQRCDGRYQAGLDTPLMSARVEVAAGDVKLGTGTSKSGHAFFRVPTTGPVQVRLVLPDGYTACGEGSTSVVLQPADFQPLGRKSVNLRVQRQR